MRLDPRKIVEDARKVGLIGFTGPVTLPPPVLPKEDKRKGKRLLRGNYKARYVITKSQRPDLFLPAILSQKSAS